ncbi:MAG: sulfatase-like hydrolase/transferase [Ferruginibacter sp.]|nr:sulfatase-like hydrolase/transferase [Ferruginibacter sp.]
MGFINIFSKRFIPVGIVFCSFVIASFFVRVGLMVYAAPHANMKIWEYAVALCSGLLYDVVVGLLVSIPFIFYVWFRNEFIYQKKVIPFIIGAFIIVISLLLFTNIVPKEFNELIFKIFVGYIIFRFCIYLLMAFVNLNTRLFIRQILMFAMLALFYICLFFNAVSECFFWEEFSTRYNFIAVDYLIYTNEVIGNIKESYPLGLFISVIGAATILTLFLLRKKINTWALSCENVKWRSLKAFMLLCVATILYFVVQEKWHRFSKNQYTNELAANGIYQFGVAFKNNDLDFFSFYKTLPDYEAFKIVKQALQDSSSIFVNSDSFSIERNIVSKLPEKKLNVVLISIESMSGEFMKHFGSILNITPYLDSLADKSMFFTNHYASGTRTVRGLEALTLSMPPVPGQSIIKRPDNDNMFTLGSVFKNKGYTTQYIYGGYSYFDNMQAFFAGNGYEVIDRSAINTKDIHYQNIWGVADEDEFALAIKTLDKNYKKGNPFFTHVMTVSNHRPFTYPDGRIDIESKMQIREGAVKYTDYCINKFLKEAAVKPWYSNTVFVIVADHCASSAGSTQLPVTGYHIPLLIFSPAHIQPTVVKELTAQIDIAPTLLGLLNFNYKSKFFGQDVLNTPQEKRRAFISTYQGLGYLKNNEMVIQSPVKKVSQYIPDYTTGNAKLIPENDSLVKEAISFYQVAAWYVKNKKYSK